MCGRFTLATPPEIVAEFFGLDSPPLIEPRYNVAPTQEVPAVVVTPDRPGRQLAMFRWGLIPAWADDPGIGNRMINARAETVAQKPAFRAAFKSRRCLVVADGFYEWQKLPKGKQPYYIRMRDGGPFAFAGLWDCWQSGDQPIRSCALLTTSPNDVLRPIHDRMPVILDPAAFDLWLDPQMKDAERLQGLLVPFPASQMLAHPVTTRVNSPARDDPGCIEPLRE